MKFNRMLMTNKDKLLLIRFITRTSMFIRTVDEENIVSFISGFELGKNGKSNFTFLLRKWLEDELSIKYSAAGWPGQIQQYCFKKSCNWVVAFRQVSLDALASEKGTELNSQMKEAIKTTVTFLIDSVNPEGSPGFDKRWVEEWQAFGTLRSKWYKTLWTNKEFQIISAITKQVKIKTFKDWKPFRPSKQLCELKNNWQTL